MYTVHVHRRACLHLDLEEAEQVGNVLEDEDRVVDATRPTIL